MKTKLFPVFVLAAGFIALGARAQVATPTTPAPVIEIPNAAPAASQFVYSPRLPSAAELTNVAAAQGLSIDRIVQSSSQMTVVYRSANGQTNTVAYMLLPAAGAPATTVASVAPTATTRVVYAEPAPEPVYYYDPFYDPYYYPGYYSPWYGPVSVNLGFGFRGGWNGGGWRGGGGRGGFHGGHH